MRSMARRMRARERIDRHQRRMRVAFVQVFADHRRGVQHQLALDQGRHRVVRIEVDQVFRRVLRIDRNKVEGDPLAASTRRTRWHSTSSFEENSVSVLRMRTLAAIKGSPTTGDRLPHRRRRHRASGRLHPECATDHHKSQ
jgi:hypothetical protein